MVRCAVTSHLQSVTLEKRGNDSSLSSPLCRFYVANGQASQQVQLTLG